VRCRHTKDLQLVLSIEHTHLTQETDMWTELDNNINI
jgi:hypothetical protein